MQCWQKLTKWEERSILTKNWWMSIANGPLATKIKLLVKFK